MITAGDKVAGTLASSAANTTCAVISIGRPAAAAAANGASSTASSRARSCSMRGSARWLSVTVSPWPGKCLPQASMPAAASPSAHASARRVTVAAVRPNARSPMIGLAGLVWTSSTGAKSMSKPSAASSRPSAAPTSLASARSASGGWLSWASIGGHCVAGARTRCTTPPS